MATSARGQTAKRRPVVHVVAVIDTDDVTIGERIRGNCAWLEAYLFRPLREHDRLGKLVVLHGASASRDRILEEIRVLPVDPSDTVLVYTASHGGLNSLSNPKPRRGDAANRNRCKDQAEASFP
jgi:hypothetical protein